ncbi:MAG TPA: ABC transporter ATP-binding protein [Stellaceae bacterium]|nr:ABC transporter ATP-binding protein [Stellaceae bacterium]
MPAHEAEELLKIERLTVAFSSLVRTVRAVRGCDLSIRRGEIMGLVGESGSGKTMLALAALDLVPPPGRVGGSIRLDGHEIVGAPEAETRKLRGRVAATIFQNPGKACNPFFTLGRQLTDVIRNARDCGRSEAWQVALDAFASVRIADPELALRKFPHQLSGGQLQRAMIAMALACEPKLLIADEPTTALDVTIRGQIILLLRDLARQRGLTVLFITHDLSIVASLCDRVTVMYAGRIVETGPVETVFSGPAHPYTASLLRAVPALGRGRAPLVQIPGSVPNMAAPPSGCAFHPRCAFADADCAAQDPAMRAIGVDRAVACHHPQSTMAP